LLKIFPEIRIGYCYDGFGNINNSLFTNKKNSITYNIKRFVRGVFRILLFSLVFLIETLIITITQILKHRIGHYVALSFDLTIL